MKLVQNCFYNAVDIREYIMIPKPDNAKSKSFEVGGSVGIFNKPFGMLSAIEFNDQFWLKRGKISDVSADRYLPPEFVTIQPAPAQMFPKKPFRFSFISAKLARTSNTQRRPPSPYPLPRGERV